MPYNTRRKSLSLPSLGIHIPMTHAARAAAAAAAAASASASTKSTSSSTPTRASSSSTSATMSHSTARSSSSTDADMSSSQPTKRIKRSHSDSPSADVAVSEQTPPLSPTTRSTSIDMTDDAPQKKVSLEGINDDIVEAVITLLQDTNNRPHLVKELAGILAQSLASVQNSANPCAIISSRLTSYLKRTCWTPIAPCPLAKELEPVHPRRTYFFLTTIPRQSIPDAASTIPAPTPAPAITPSVSLTDDSGSDDVESRRREISPSPEIDLSPEFDDVEDDISMPLTPIGSLPTQNSMRGYRERRHDSPPLEKEEREFSQTADVLQKRKLSDKLAPQETLERSSAVDFGYKDDVWFGDNNTTAILASPHIKPSYMPIGRKDDEAETWLDMNKLFELEKGAESIEIDELDGLLDMY